MMRRLRRTILALLLPVACFGALSAQTQQRNITIHLDPAQTEIHWTLGGVLHKVHGTFRLKGGIVVFDPATGAAEGEILVDLDSGQSGNATRDRLMKKNVLETATYPEAIFHPEKIAGRLAPGTSQQLTVDGTFTIHGKDHPLRLVVAAQMTGASEVQATTQFVVPYVAWGMKDPSTFVLRVGKQVVVNAVARGTVSGME